MWSSPLFPLPDFSESRASCPRRVNDAFVGATGRSPYENLTNREIDVTAPLLYLYGQPLWLPIFLPSHS